jgi:hypothetical protein
MCALSYQSREIEMSIFQYDKYSTEEDIVELQADGEIHSIFVIITTIRETRRKTETFIYTKGEESLR